MKLKYEIMQLLWVSLNNSNIRLFGPLGLIFFLNLTTDTLWSISKKLPDLVKYLNRQVRLIAKYGLNVGVP